MILIQSEKGRVRSMRSPEKRVSRKYSTVVSTLILMQSEKGRVRSMRSPEKRVSRRYCTLYLDTHAE